MPLLAIADVAVRVSKGLKIGPGSSRNIFQCRFDCLKCNEADDGGEDEEGAEEELGANKRQKHCHCPLWKPFQELITSMSGGQPWHRYKDELNKRKVEAWPIALYNVDEVTRKGKRL